MMMMMMMMMMMYVVDGFRELASLRLSQSVAYRQSRLPLLLGLTRSLLSQSKQLTALEQHLDELTTAEQNNMVRDEKEEEIDGHGQ